MKILPGRSITRKLNTAITATSLISLLLAGAAFMIYDWISFRTSLSRELMSLANLVGYNSVALLEFKDPVAGEETLSNLQADPRIVSAVLYDENGNRFAEYQRNSSKAVKFPETAPQAGELIDEGFALLYMDIQNNGRKVGTIGLRSDMKELKTRFARYGLIVLGILVASGFLAYLLALRLQRGISTPILDLAETTRQASEKEDYSLRGEKRDDDEVGFLVDRFNDLMAQIQDREKEVREAHEILEQRVEERTQDLQNEIDIRKHLQGELVQAKDEAENANRAKSEFLSRMSHELRTPLNAILGFGQILDNYSDSKLNASQKECVEHILNSGELLLELINEILDLSRIELGRIKLEIRDVNVGVVIQDTLALLQKMAEDNEIQLINQVPAGLERWVQADPVRLKQVLLNLGSNAIKYNKPGGTVHFRFEESTKKMGRMEVIDTGRGIDLEKQKQIFEPFNRLGAEGTEVEGTGIGLTITKSLVELMNGSLIMESQPGQGSCFAVELPFSAMEVEASAVSPNGSEGKDRGKHLVRTYKILYVEDNPFNMKLVESILGQRRNIDFISARNGELGLEMARAHRPDLILMDINLPGMSGHAVFEELKKEKETQDIPVIAVSADAMEENIQKALNLGFISYITKPLDIQNFLTVLEQALAQIEGRRKETRNKV